MREAFELVYENAGKSAARNQGYYDHTVHGVTLSAGVKVPVWNLSVCGGPEKLKAYWKKHIHVVTKKMENHMVYKVVPEDQQERARELHHSLLLAFDY